jgi:hypothetical protein
MKQFAQGERVIIRAIKNEGSARILDGLTAVIVGPHPITPNWFRIQLDPNPITPHRDWTIPASGLVPFERSRAA